MKAVDFEKAFDDIDEKILERFFDVNERFSTKTEPKKKNCVLKLL